MDACELKEELLASMMDAAELGKQCSYLQNENAKLRKLIADVHEALCADELGIFHKLILACMEDDMRELEVEVTE